MRFSWQQQYIKYTQQQERVRSVYETFFYKIKRRRLHGQIVLLQSQWRAEITESIVTPDARRKVCEILALTIKLLRRAPQGRARVALEGEELREFEIKRDVQEAEAQAARVAATVAVPSTHGWSNAMSQPHPQDQASPVRGWPFLSTNYLGPYSSTRVWLPVPNCKYQTMTS